jgi:hypothetical protein
MSIFPLSSHKKRGITPTLGEQYPLKKAKKRGYSPASLRGVLFWAISVLGCYWLFSSAMFASLWLALGYWLGFSLCLCLLG